MKNLRRFLSCLLAVTMLLALGVTASAAEFTDVPAGSDYAEAVQWASDNGYIYGYGDGRFGVNDDPAFGIRPIQISGGIGFCRSNGKGVAACGVGDISGHGLGAAGSVTQYSSVIPSGGASPLGRWTTSSMPTTSPGKP